MGLGINASGNVCGGSYLSAADPHLGGLHAFRWVDGLGMIDVGVLQTVNISEAQGINAGAQDGRGQLRRRRRRLGAARISGKRGSYAHGSGTLGGDYSYAWDINDQGVVTGEAANKALDVHAFIWTSAGMSDIGTLGGARSVGRAINESGQVAGESQISQGNAIRAFRFTQGAGMVNLGTLSEDPAVLLTASITPATWSARVTRGRL
jgi:probable HAF family extracellular repeat protein